MNLAFTFALCIVLIGGCLGANGQQSAPTALSILSVAKNDNASQGLEESDCVRKEKLRRRFLADIGTRVDRSALMRASATGRTQTVRALLRRGVAVNKRDAIGLTALMLAAEGGHLEIIKALLAAGADANAAGGTAHGPTFSVMTMAMTSSNKNRVDVLDTLIAAGAELNPERGATIVPLVYAIEACDVVMIRSLLDRGADVNWNGGEPLMAAVTNAYPEVEIVKLLLAAGADPNLPRFDVGGEEKTLLSYLEQELKWSRDPGGKRDGYHEEILLLLKKAGAKS